MVKSHERRRTAHSSAGSIVASNKYSEKPTLLQAHLLLTLQVLQSIMIRKALSCHRKNGEIPHLSCTQRIPIMSSLILFSNYVQYLRHQTMRDKFYLPVRAGSGSGLPMTASGFVSTSINGKITRTSGR